MRFRLLVLAALLLALAVGATPAAAIVPLGQFGEGPGDQAGLLDSPRGVAVDASGRLYTREGAFRSAFGRGVNGLPGGRTDICVSRCQPGQRGDVAGALDIPTAVAVDAAFNVYVSEFVNNRVSVFGPDVAFQRAFGADVIPNNETTGFEVCTSASGCKVGSTGGVFGPGPSGPNGPGVLNGPAGMTVGGDGLIHVVELQSNRASAVSPGLAFLGAFGKDVVPDNPVIGFEECDNSCQAGSSAGAGPGELARPNAVTRDCRGAVYVADVGNGRVQRFGEPGTETPPCSQPPALSKPFGIMRARRNARNGTATLFLTVPWSAEVRLRGRGIRPAVKQVEFARRTRLALRPTAQSRRRLNRTGRAQVRAKVIYLPWGGKRRVKTRAVGLRKQPPSKENR